MINRSQGKIEKGILGLALEAKMGDQRQSLRNLKDQQGVIRGELTTMCGRGTMAYRRSLRKLKRVGRAEDQYQSSMLVAKFDHLRVKHSRSLKERGSTAISYKPKWRDKYPANV